MDLLLSGTLALPPAEHIQRSEDQSDNRPNNQIAIGAMADEAYQGTHHIDDASNHCGFDAVPAYCARDARYEQGESDQHAATGRSVRCILFKRVHDVCSAGLEHYDDKQDCRQNTDDHSCRSERHDTACLLLRGSWLRRWLLILRTCGPLRLSRLLTHRLSLI